jgi:nitrate/nitrite transporter NarK
LGAGNQAVQFLAPWFVSVPFVERVLEMVRRAVAHLAVISTFGFIGCENDNAPRAEVVVVALPLV